jgi:hypothetical protein
METNFLAGSPPGTLPPGRRQSLSFPHNQLSIIAATNGPEWDVYVPVSAIGGGSGFTALRSCHEDLSLYIRSSVTQWLFSLLVVFGLRARILAVLDPENIIADQIIVDRHRAQISKRT